MTIAPRWRKLLGDLAASQGRVALMVAALTAGIFALSTIVSAYAILTREISRNYLDTNPASALIDVGAVTNETLATARNHPEIAGAEAASILAARIEMRPGEWARLMLFVVPDFERLSIGKVFPQEGAFPPPEGSILFEREALTFIGRQIGERVTIQLPGGSEAELPVAGTVHDPSLAPAWQEQTAWGYVSAATLSTLDGGAPLELIKVVVRDALFDQKRVDAVTADLALGLQSRGTDIHQMQVPPTGQHPHQAQMTGVLAMFIVFAALTLILSAILTASMVSALLAQQVRQIAIMKAVGGSSWQIASLYLSGVAAIAATGAIIGIPFGLLSGAGFAGVVGQLLNFDLASSSVSPMLIAGLAAVGIAVPVGFVWMPVRRATRATVREALSDYGVSRDALETDALQRFLGRLRGIDRTLLLALRNAFRRRGRLLLNIALLGIAGGMFLASLNVETAWRQQLALGAQERSHDIEVRLADPRAESDVVPLLSALPEVAGVITANVVAAAPGRPDGLTVVRTYPDGGHGGLSLRVAAKPTTGDEVFLQGGGLDQAGPGAVVLNQSAWNLLGRPALGAPVVLVVDGGPVTAPLGGVMRQILTPAAAYLGEAAFDAATGLSGQVNALRIVTAEHSADAIAAVASEVEAALSRAGIDIGVMLTETTLDQAQSGHVKILVVALMVMAGILATVGSIGLASSQGTNVTERIREFGIMRTIGASGGVLIRNILAEGMLIGLVSLPVALLVSVPLGYGVGTLVGTLSFGLPLPLAFSGTALLIWLVILFGGSIGASLWPALTATRLTIRQTLAHT